MKYTLLKFPGFKTRAVTVSYDDGIIYDKITASAPKTNDEYLQKARDILGNIHGVIE